MRAPDFDTTTRLVARFLSLDPQALAQGFRRAGMDDMAGILALRRRNLPPDAVAVDADYLPWRYRLGRPGRGFGDLWVVEARGTLLGILGTEEMTVDVPGGRHSGVRTMDILVDQPARQSGLGVWLNQAIFRTADFTLAVGGNELSAGTVKRLFHPLPPIQAWAQPLDLRPYARRRLGDGLSASVAGNAANFALRAWRRVAAATPASSMRIGPIDRFDAAAEALVAAPQAEGWAIERGTACLNVRLFDNPRARYDVVGAWRDGILAGYVAWRPVVGPRGESFAHVGDWRAGPDEGSDVLPALFARVAHQAAAAGCSSVIAAHQRPEAGRRLLRVGFVGPRPAFEKIVGLHVRDPAHFEALAKAPWSLVALDDDNDGA